MWKIDRVGTAVNVISESKDTYIVESEYFTILKSYTVVKARFGTRKPVERLATFNTLDEAIGCVRELVTEKKLNAEETENARRPVEENPA